MPEETTTTITVDIVDGAFKTDRVNVKIGETVQWVNFGTDPVTIKVGAITSPALKTKESFERVFEVSGEFDFFIVDTPDVKGAVTVGDKEVPDEGTTEAAAATE